jgi:HAE1 family hydrophobic/amphiphilic exporter-1
MFISDFAIRRPLVTITAMLALVVFGIFALANLDTDEFPEINPPFVSVAVPYPGASPDVVEREVIEPIEEAVSGIAGVDEIRSSALDGFGLINVAFVFEKDVQAATQDIRDKISEIRGDLPPEMEEPILSRFDPNDLPIMSLTLTSARMSSAELTRLADPGVTRELRALPGVAQVDVVGGVERELTVEIDPEALQAAGVGIGEVAAALQAQNLAAPVGRLTGAMEESTIRLHGRLESPADFAQLVVAERGGDLVRLGQLARIRDGTEEPRTLALYDDEVAVGIDVVKATNASTTAVADAVRERVAQVQRRLPEGVQLRVVRDAGTRVDTSVGEVEEALIEGALLTVFVVFLFLNSWRSTVITGLALPVSVIASFVAVWALGFTLNTMSLLGLSLAIGILIDDAIVVRENIVRHVEMGKDHYTAAREGTDEIGLAVAATTFSIVVVFVPVAFMGGLAGQWFKPFAATIAASVLVSLLVSFSLDPMLSAYWADPELEEHQKSRLTRWLDRFNAWFNRQAERYKRVIAWALDHRLAMVGIATLSFIVALALPITGILGGAFFPVQDISEFVVIVEAPPGSSLDYTRLQAQEVSRAARASPEVRYTYTTIGGQSGAVDEAQVYVRLHPKAERDRVQHEVEADLRRALQRMGGATAYISTGGFDSPKQVAIQLSGPDLETLNRLGDTIAAEVRRVPGAVDVGLSTKGRRPELDVELQRGLAGSLGITVAQVAQALRPAFAGIDVGDWVDPTGETRDVTIRLSPEARARVADVAQLPLVLSGAPADGAANGASSGNGGAGAVTLPLAQVAEIRRGLGPAQIDHLDRERVLSVEANTQGRSLSEVVRDIQGRLEGIDIPPDYRVSYGGETEAQQEVFGQIFLALGVAVMLMYLILVLQFGSFLDPLAIMLSLPLSLIGVMLGLLVTGSTLNLMSLIGVILLMGIVAKNAILLIDFAKWSEEKGTPRREALIEAGRVRLRPILMTTFALIAGMIPVALGRGEGADFRAPLGVAVIGGVITSTLLTLLVIPTVYEILSEWRDWALEKVRARFGHAGARRHGAPATEAGD